MDFVILLGTQRGHFLLWYGDIFTVKVDLEKDNNVIKLLPVINYISNEKRIISIGYSFFVAYF